jgi:transcriptional regulator with XRE-family HTH domain
MTPIPTPGSMTAAELTALRECLGLSRAELARRLGISRSQLHNYERGRDRGTGRPCPIPLTVELACRALAGSLPAKDPDPHDR